MREHRYTLLDGRTIRRTQHTMPVEPDVLDVGWIVTSDECTIDGEPIDLDAAKRLIVDDWTKRVLEQARLRDHAGERFDVC